MAEPSTPFKTYTKNTYSSKNPSRTLYIILFVLLIVVLGVGAAQFFSSRSKGSKGAVPTPIVFSEPTSTPTTTPEAIPSPSDAETTPSPSTSPDTSSSVDKATGLDRAKLTVNVLNGSTRTGMAKTTADKLKDLGYTIGTVGNATSSDYDTTAIYVKSASKAYLALLKKDLAGDYTIGTASSSLTGTADAQVIVGAE